MAKKATNPTWAPAPLMTYEALVLALTGCWIHGDRGSRTTLDGTEARSIADMLLARNLARPNDRKPGWYWCRDKQWMPQYWDGEEWYREPDEEYARIDRPRVIGQRIESPD